MYFQEVEGTQWGKPGPGGAYWRPSAITGQVTYLQTEILKH